MRIPVVLRGLQHLLCTIRRNQRSSLADPPSSPYILDTSLHLLLVKAWLFVSATASIRRYPQNGNFGSEPTGPVHEGLVLGRNCVSSKSNI